MIKALLIVMTAITLASLATATYLYRLDATRLNGFATIRTAAEMDEKLETLRGKALLVDLRDRKDFEEGHLAGFSNFSFDDGGKRLTTWITPFNRSKPVILICYAGNRSARAFELLVQMGFRNITDFASGYEAYAAEKGTAFQSETGSCNCPE